MLVTTSTILTDAHQRNHNYLRISLTEKCNLRCNYCMPLEGVTLSPKVAIMTAQEVIDIASLFVKHGVTKIRLTGGEPFVRKDFKDIIIGLQQLGVELAITTNGILLDRHWKQLQNIGVTNITVSLDTLKRERFLSITHRNQFDKVIRNIKLLQNTLSIVKINVVPVSYTHLTLPTIA